jgi:hypothetical protein
MCTTCGCNYPNVEHSMANAKGKNEAAYVNPVPSSIKTATPKKPKK